MDVQVELITPQIAGLYLAANTHNRTCGDSRIRELAGSMKRNEWQLNGDAIRFDVEGVLADGQGRLKACLLSGIPFTTLVIRGLPKEAFKTIDLGKKRSVADVLSIEGEANATKLARCLRFIAFYECGTYNGVKVTPQQADELLKRHPGVRKWTQAGASLYRITGHGAMLSAVAYLGSITRPSQAEDFVRLLLEGTGLTKGSPVLVLRDRLQQDRAASSKLTPSYVAQLAIHGYNAFVRKESQRFLLKGNVSSCELPRILP